MRNYRDDELPPLMESPAAQPPPPQAAPAPQSPPDVQSVLGDPAFRAFLAQRAQALSQAQGEASGRQRWADVANSFERARAWGNKVDPDQGAIQANNARAQSPVTQLQQRQAGESQAIKDVDVAQQMGERGAKASRMRAEDDPNSDLSRRAKMLAVAQKLIPAGYAGPYSASMHQDMLKGASIEQAREHAAAQMKMGEAHLAETHQAHQDLKAYREDSLAQRGELREGQFNERELQQLSKGDQKSRAALAAYEAGKKLIDRINGAGGEVKGMGRFENMVPTMLSPEAWQLNQADAAEFAKSVLLMKGGAITPKAIDLQMKALGMTPGSDVKVFKHGIQTGMDEISRAMRQREAGFRPSNVAEYKNREGLTSDVVDDTKKGLGAPAAAAAPAGRPQRTVNGETREWDGKAWVPLGG
jgi:hypothetical protein